MSILMALWSVFRPKSLLVALIDVLIDFFHTHFDRGLKARLFLLPHGCSTFPHLCWGSINLWRCELERHIVMLVSQIESHCDSHIPEKKCFEISGLPNEDLGRMNKRWNADFQTSFQWCEYSMLAKIPWKSFGNPHFIFCSSFQNLRLGGLKFESKKRFETFVRPSKIFVWEGQTDH